MSRQHPLPHHLWAPVCLLMHPLMGPRIQPLRHSLLGPYSSLHAHSAKTLQRQLRWAREPPDRACLRGLDERCGVWLALGAVITTTWLLYLCSWRGLPSTVVSGPPLFRKALPFPARPGCPASPSSRRSLWRRFYLVHPCSSVVYSQHSKHSAAGIRKREPEDLLPPLLKILQQLALSPRYSRN